MKKDPISLKIYKKSQKKNTLNKKKINKKKRYKLCQCSLIM
nr:MAG TPA_asm: hypothetical protein [Caudoviricetes sp.]